MNLIAALCNIVESSDFSLKNSDGYVSNLASSQGIPFETFVKTIFCGIRGKPETFVNSNDVFAHNGSTNNPPDAMIREIAKEINGGGGGQPFFATAGGDNTAGISFALVKAKEIIG